MKKAIVTLTVLISVISIYSWHQGPPVLNPTSPEASNHGEMKPWAVSLPPEIKTVTAQTDLRDVIEKIDQEIEDKERYLYNENAIARLNTNQANPMQRAAYAKAIADVARLRSQKVELKLRKLEAEIAEARVRP